MKKKKQKEKTMQLENFQNWARFSFFFSSNSNLRYCNKIEKENNTIFHLKKIFFFFKTKDRERESVTKKVLEDLKNKKKKDLAHARKRRPVKISNIKFI